MNNTTSTLATRLARPQVVALVPYQSARRICATGDIWLNANESPFNNTDIDGINRYPDCQPRRLIEAYSQYASVPPEKILTSRGADEAIELLIKTFCRPKIDSIACFGPTYGMYTVSAQSADVMINAQRLDDQYQLPNDLVAQANNAKLVFICNPNNPTGTVIKPDVIEKIIKQLPESLVVVDEAYIEFCPDYSVAPLLDTYPNLVILRTLSKAFALAGARCGFMLAGADIITMVMKVIAPYPVPLPVANLACDALSANGIATMRSQVKTLKQNGRRLAQVLQSIGAKVLPSNSNFILASFNDITPIIKKLDQAGIVARRYADPSLINSIRFSFTNNEETDKLIAVLKH